MAVRPLFFSHVKPLVVSLLLCTGAARVSAQHAGHVIPVVPADLLARPATIHAGIGTAHDAVATTSPAAQRFYDQGLCYLHSYVWIEAARSFHQALRLDPALAIARAQLSIALAELNKPAEARAAIDEARQAAAKLPDHDRRHIEARALQFDAERNAGDAKTLSAYRRALDAGIAAYPRDVEFLLLRGIAESPDAADRGQGAVAAAVPFWQKALAISPGHFAAQHYLAHAFENSGRAAEALVAAEAYAKQAPAIPHAHHMFGHNLRRAGRTSEAIDEFEAADRLHRDYFARESIGPELDWHYHHNLDLLATSRLYLGQAKQAAALLEQSFTLPSNLVVQVYNKRLWPAFLRGRGRLDAAMAAARTLTTHPHPLVQAAGHIEAGYAYLATGRGGEAANESNSALRLLRTGAEGGAIAAPALLGLQGEIALRTGDRDKGRRVLLDVAARVRALPGPDGWVQALFMLEAMARAARQVGDWELAGELAQEMLAHDPLYGGTQYAVALVAEHNGDVKGARAAFALAQKYWSQADPDFSEVIEIKKRLK